MALETAATIAELNPANPVGASDSPSTLDDHIRLLKTVLQADALVEADRGVTVQSYDADIPTVSASQGEMEAGTEAALRSMSPLRVAQAIAALTPDAKSITFGDSTVLASSPVGGFKNKIINGGFNVNQRGSVACTAAAAYGPDRWLGVLTGGTGITATFNNPTNAGWKSGYVGTISGTWTTGAPTIGTRIESYLCHNLLSQNVTVSARVYHDSGSSVNFYIQAYHANAKDNFTGITSISTSSAIPVASGSVTDITFTFNAGANAGNGLHINIYTEAITVASKNVLIGDVQLELGSVVTPFELRPIGTELALCQRYYYRITLGAGGYFGDSFNYTNGQAIVTIKHPISMRSASSSLEQSGTAGNYGVLTTSGVVTCDTVPSFGVGGVDLTVVNFFKTAGYTAGQGGKGYCNTAGAYLGFSAEL